MSSTPLGSSPTPPPPPIRSDSTEKLLGSSPVDSSQQAAETSKTDATSAIGQAALEKDSKAGSSKIDSTITIVPISIEPAAEKIVLTSQNRAKAIDLFTKNMFTKIEKDSPMYKHKLALIEKCFATDIQAHFEDKYHMGVDMDDTPESYLARIMENLTKTHPDMTDEEISSYQTELLNEYDAVVESYNADSADLIERFPDTPGDPENQSLLSGPASDDPFAPVASSRANNLPIMGAVDKYKNFIPIYLVQHRAEANTALTTALQVHQKAADEFREKMAEKRERVESVSQQALGQLQPDVKVLTRNTLPINDGDEKSMAASGGTSGGAGGATAVGTGTGIGTGTIAGTSSGGATKKTGAWNTFVSYIQSFFTSTKRPSISSKSFTPQKITITDGAFQSFISSITKPFSKAPVGSKILETATRSGGAVLLSDALEASYTHLIARTALPRKDGQVILDTTGMPELPPKFKLEALKKTLAYDAISMIPQKALQLLKLTINKATLNLNPMAQAGITYTQLKEIQERCEKFDATQPDGLIKIALLIRDMKKVASDNSIPTDAFDALIGFNSLNVQPEKLFESITTNNPLFKSNLQTVLEKYDAPTPNSPEYRRILESIDSNVLTSPAYSKKIHESMHSQQQLMARISRIKDREISQEEFLKVVLEPTAQNERTEVLKALVHNRFVKMSDQQISELIKASNNFLATNQGLRTINDLLNTDNQIKENDVKLVLAEATTLLNFYTFLNKSGNLFTTIKDRIQLHRQDFYTYAIKDKPKFHQDFIEKVLVNQLIFGASGDKVPNWVVEAAFHKEFSQIDKLAPYQKKVDLKDLREFDEVARLDHKANVQPAVQANVTRDQIRNKLKDQDVYASTKELVEQFRKDGSEKILKEINNVLQLTVPLTSKDLPILEKQVKAIETITSGFAELEEDQEIKFANVRDNYVNGRQGVTRANLLKYVQTIFKLKEPVTEEQEWALFSNFPELSLKKAAVTDYVATEKKAQIEARSFAEAFVEYNKSMKSSTFIGQFEGLKGNNPSHSHAKQMWKLTEADGTTTYVNTESGISADSDVKPDTKGKSYASITRVPPLVIYNLAIDLADKVTTPRQLEALSKTISGILPLLRNKYEDLAAGSLLDALGSVKDSNQKLKDRLETLIDRYVSVRKNLNDKLNVTSFSKTTLNKVNEENAAIEFIDTFLKTAKNEQFPWKSVTTKVDINKKDADKIVDEFNRKEAARKDYEEDSRIKPKGINREKWENEHDVNRNKKADGNFVLDDAGNETRLQINTTETHYHTSDRSNMEILRGNTSPRELMTPKESFDLISDILFKYINPQTGQIGFSDPAQNPKLTKLIDFLQTQDMDPKIKSQLTSLKKILENPEDDLSPAVQQPKPAATARSQAPGDHMDNKHRAAMQTDGTHIAQTDNAVVAPAPTAVRTKVVVDENFSTLFLPGEGGSPKMYKNAKDLLANKNGEITSYKDQINVASEWLKNELPALIKDNSLEPEQTQYIKNLKDKFNDLVGFLDYHNSKTPLAGKDKELLAQFRDFNNQVNSAAQSIQAQVQKAAPSKVEVQQKPLDVDNMALGEFDEKSLFESRKRSSSSRRGEGDALVSRNAAQYRLSEEDAKSSRSSSVSKTINPKAQAKYDEFVEKLDKHLSLAEIGKIAKSFPAGEKLWNSIQHVTNLEFSGLEGEHRKLENLELEFELQGTNTADIALNTISLQLLSVEHDEIGLLKELKTQIKQAFAKENQIPEEPDSPSTYTIRGRESVRRREELTKSVLNQVVIDKFVQESIGNPNADVPVVLKGAGGKLGIGFVPRKNAKDHGLTLEAYRTFADTPGRLSQITKESGQDREVLNKSLLVFLKTRLDKELKKDPNAFLDKNKRNENDVDYLKNQIKIMFQKVMVDAKSASNAAQAKQKEDVVEADVKLASNAVAQSNQKEDVAEDEVAADDVSVDLEEEIDVTNLPPPPPPKTAPFKPTSSQQPIASASEASSVAPKAKKPLPLTPPQLKAKAEQEAKAAQEKLLKAEDDDEIPPPPADENL